MPAAALLPSAAPLKTPGLQGRRIHFMGAGGIGVSALMELARARGAVVSGCDGDCSCNGQVPHLRRLGIPVQEGHSPEHLAGCDELVYTPAIREDHAEIRQARALGLTVSVRMAFLGRLARGFRTIGVTGSHGKTSLTWMIAHLLASGGRDPSVLVGGVVPSLGSNFRIGRSVGQTRGGELVLEVDESDNRLDRVLPTLPVVTNIDADHLDHYGSLEALERALTRYLASATQSGDEQAALVGCGDDPRVLRALQVARQETGLPLLDYGFAAGRTLRGLAVEAQGMVSRFSCQGPFGSWRGLSLPMPGLHMVQNALGAIAVAWHLGLGEEEIREGLACCERVGRRFEIKGHCRGARVVDDYGHHPTEIAATIRAATSSSQGRLAVLFQPHRYSRTAALLEEFAQTFRDAGIDRLILLPVYAASEERIEGATHEALCARIRALGFLRVEAMEDRAQAVAALRSWSRPGDTLLVQGAGDVTLAGTELVAAG